MALLKVRSFLAPLVVLCLVAGLKSQSVRITSVPGTSPDEPSLGPITARGTAALEGRVIDASTGEPVSEAVVSIGDAATKSLLDKLAVLAAGPGASLSDPRVLKVTRVLTGPDGAFTFTNLPAGSFNISAAKTGYSNAYYGQDGNVNARPLVLAGSSVIKNVVVRLPRRSTLSGRVLNDLSEPMVGVTVISYRRVWAVGKLSDIPTGKSAVTNDQGEYTLAIDEPGNYLVRLLVVRSNTAEWNPDSTNFLGSLMPLAMNEGALAKSIPLQLPDGVMIDDTALGTTPLIFPDRRGHALTYVSVFYPASSTTEGGIPIAVRAGENPSNLDIVSAPAETGGIRGEITGISDPANLVVQFIPGRASQSTVSLSTPVGRAVADRGGRFVIYGLPAGDYTAQVVKGPRVPAGGGLSVSGGGRASSLISELSKTPALWAAESVTVGANSSERVVLQMRTAFAVTGQVNADQLRSAPQTIKCQLLRADGAYSTVAPDCQIKRDGSLMASNVLPDNYVLQITRPNGTSVLERVTLHGVDVTDRPINITSDIVGLAASVADHLGSLAGTYLGKASGTVTVGVFPTASADWADFGPSPRRFRTATLAGDGGFLVSDLPAAEYFVVVLDSETVGGAWLEERSLKQLATSAVRVSILPGQSARVTIGRVPLDHIPLADGSIDQVVGWFGENAVQYGSTDGQTKPVPQASPADALQGTVTLKGRVIDDSPDKSAVKRSRIVIDGVRGRTITVADDDGRFEERLPRGYYTTFADKPGYLRAYYGSTRPGYGPGVPIALGYGEPIEVLIVAVRAGSISGNVSCNGRPVVDAKVRLTDLGEDAVAPREVRSDGVGHYRFAELPPGRYAVSSMAMPLSFSGAPTGSAAAIGAQTPEPGLTIVPAFYPDSINAESIQLGLGQQLTGIDLNLTVAAVAEVLGSLIGPAGQPISGSVRLTANNGFNETRVAVAARDGQFEFDSIPPGNYEVTASISAANPDDPGLQAMFGRVTVSLQPGDARHYELRLQWNPTVSGQIQTPAGRPWQAAPKIVLEPIASSKDERRRREAVVKDGRFDFLGIEPGQYRLSVGPLQDSRGVLWPMEVLDRSGTSLPATLELSAGQHVDGLQIRYSETPTQLIGTVIDSDGRPATGVAVLCFAVDPAKWYPGSSFVAPLVRPATDGTYALVGLGPGDYWVAAIIPDSVEAPLLDQSFLEQLSMHALRVTVTRGQTTKQDLAVVRKP